MNKIFIGITGYKRSGKDELCSNVIDFLGAVGVQVSKYSFADPIKDVGLKLHGWDEEHREGDLKEVQDPIFGYSPRQWFQWFGTEFGRKYCGDDYWVKLAKINSKDTEIVIVPDVRFPNEVDFILSSGGIMVSVERDATEQNTDLHESEQHIKSIRDKCAVRIQNNGSLADLRYQADFVASQIYGLVRKVL